MYHLSNDFETEIREFSLRIARRSLFSFSHEKRNPSGIGSRDIVLVLQHWFVLNLRMER